MLALTGSDAADRVKLFVGPASPGPVAERIMRGWVRTRLSAMMFLHYGSLGAWAVTMSTYLLESPLQGGLGFSSTQVSWIYSTFALGGMLVNPIVGLLADRLFAAERVYAVANAFAAVLLVAAAQWCDSAAGPVHEGYILTAQSESYLGRSLLEWERGRATDPGRPVDEERRLLREALGRLRDAPGVHEHIDRAYTGLFVIMLLQALALQISMTLSTVLSLRNLPDPTLDFSRTRMWGTIGWVAAGWVLGLVVDIRSPGPFYLAAATTGLLSLYALTLPHTPPRGRGRTLGEAFGLPAFQLFRDRSFVVFILVAWFSAMINQFYGVYGHKMLTDFQVPVPERWMTFGQIVEVVVMFCIPLLRPGQTMKWLMLLGLGGWVLRWWALGTADANWALAVGVPMHGWSFAFYFIVAATYIDREAPPHLRASAQAIVSFVSSGLAPWTGNMLAAAVVERYRSGDYVDWSAVCQPPLMVSLLLFLGFFLWFQPPPERGQAERGQAGDDPQRSRSPSR